MSNFAMVSDDSFRELSAERYDDALQEALESLGWKVVTEQDAKELFPDEIS